MYKLMLIEDDLQLSNIVKEHLDKYDFNVIQVNDFINIESIFDLLKPDLVILDINLPYLDGFHLCRCIRRKSNIPVIITSARSGDMDQIMAIELGADDYITKPFKVELLLAKIKASIRRAYEEYSSKEGQPLKVGNLQLYEDNLKMIYRKESVDLSKNEFKLLRILMKKKGKIVSREEIFEELWDDSSFVDDNTLTVNISRIKNKLSELGVKDAIRNKRGVGYILDPKAFGDETDE